jgi:6-phosphofructokinase 1
MGRHAGWLAYGVAVAGEAHMVVGAEDVVGELADGDRLNIDALADRIVELIVVREARGKAYGTVVLAEGLAELLPDAIIAGLPRDEHGQLSLGKLDLAKLMAVRVAEGYARRTGRQKKLTGVQLGYESRCAPPHAFDVLLGCQLGLGAQRALSELALDGCMVSLAGQLQLHYVPFDTLVDPVTLMAQVRFVERGSDFHRLATQLGTQLK